MGAVEGPSSQHAKAKLGTKSIYTNCFKFASLNTIYCKSKVLFLKPLAVPLQVIKKQEGERHDEKKAVKAIEHTAMAR